MKKVRVSIILTIVFVLTAGILYTISLRLQSEDETIVQELASSNEVSTSNLQNVIESNPEPESENKVFSEETESVSDVVDSQKEALDEAPDIFIYLCGAVEDPGVFEVKQGSRLIDVIELAGGFTKEAAEDYVNLAQEVFDGQQVIIPEKSEVEEIERGEHIQSVNESNEVDSQANPKSQTTSESKRAVTSKQEGGNTISDTSSQSLVNLNTATKEELMTLSGVGDAKAELIIEYRENVGKFDTIEDIMKIRGIKEGLFNKIADQITVD